MKYFEKIKAFLTGIPKAKEAPEGTCPNCWGRQEYGGNFFDTVHQEQIDLNNIDSKKGWINAYAAKHFEGIELQTAGDGFVCPSCKVTYKADH